MIRADKIQLVKTLNEAFQSTPHVILASFSGLSVNQEGELRRRVRAAGGSYAVIKNRLARRAAAGTAVEKLADQLSGPCALATHATDPVVLAKVLSEFAKDNPQVELRAGVVDAAELLDTAGVKTLASLPGLPELRAQLLALVLTPATMLVRLLSTPGSQLARVINAHCEDQGGAEQAAEAPEAESAEAESAEAESAEAEGGTSQDGETQS